MLTRPCCRWLETGGDHHLALVKERVLLERFDVPLNSSMNGNCHTLDLVRFPLLGEGPR